MNEKEEKKIEELSDDQKLAFTQDWREISNDEVMFDQRRGSDISDNFTSLEVQVAAILFAFCGIFVDKFTSTASAGTVATFNFSPIVGGIIKFGFAAGVLMLIISFALGLLTLPRKEKFWKTRMERHLAQFRNWNEASRRGKTFEQAREFHAGTVAGMPDIEGTPLWTWILQSITLGIAVLLLFSVFLVFLIHS